jgi:chorismate dehydratase
MQNSATALRIGAVSYLNSKPLVEGLNELLPRTEIRLDFPSRLADQLGSGRLDVALIPSIEYFRGDRYEVISDACVAAHGPVLSVKLYSRVPWGDVKTLALDEGSRTSATLARILLAERHGVLPKLEPLPLNHRTEDATADAILLIGDRAILPPEEAFRETWDLGEEWFAWTGLPFVFAMWVASDPLRIPRVDGRFPAGRGRGLTDPGFETPPAWTRSPADDLDFVRQALSQSRDRGVLRLDDIARREAPLLGLSLPTTIRYLSENLQYHLGNAERCGLKLFYELAAGLDLAPTGVPLVFRPGQNV